MPTLYNTIANQHPDRLAALGDDILAVALRVARRTTARGCGGGDPARGAPEGGRCTDPVCSGRSAMRGGHGGEHRIHFARTAELSDCAGAAAVEAHFCEREMSSLL